MPAQTRPKPLSPDPARTRANMRRGLIVLYMVRHSFGIGVMGTLCAQAFQAKMIPLAIALLLGTLVYLGFVVYNGHKMRNGAGPYRTRPRK